MSTRIVQQIFWFCIAGVLGFLVEVSIIQLGITMSFGPILPRFISLPTAIWITFLVNKHLSFKTEAKKDRNHFFTYFICMLLGATLNFGLYTIAVLSGITPVACLAIAVAVTAIFNFLVSRFIFLRVQH